MTPSTSSRVERRKARTRQALLEVALVLFSEKGIYWTKIEDITERADIGKGTFYKYFETKEALLRTLLQQGLDLLLMRTKDAAHGVKPGPKLVGKIIAARVDFFLEHPEYLLLFHQVRGLLQLKTESAKDLRSVYNEHLDRLGDLLRPALAGNGAAKRTLATALAAYTSGLLTYYLLFDKADELKRRRGEIQAQLERSLQALL
ncbi:MAG TPA: TetR/AcrR family transcriptional regulator [Nitrospiraceae bacterium]|jgi:AcrR family transcriptional regulator|nr:TetR/AcrR family transcriptional regulator [Nitrospiraceae bacterium]